MNIVIPERITQARELAGLNKTELANAVGVSVASITQWENDTKHPTTENLGLISRVLDVPLEMLLAPCPAQVSRRGPLTFRATRAAKTARLRRRALRFLEVATEVYIWLEEYVSMPTADLPEIAPGTDIEEAASQCRRHWSLGDLPIKKLGELFESKGIRVCSVNFPNSAMDGFSCIIASRPFVVLGSVKQDRARSRMDAAHELGHLVLHQHYSDDEFEDVGNDCEDEAKAFAGAFLLPVETFSRDVVDTSLNGFLRLKSKWGVSVQGMVRRARDLGLITQDTYERHYRSIGFKKWRKPKGEPYDDLVPAVNRTLGERCLNLLEQSGEIMPWQIADSLPFPDYVFEWALGKDLKSMNPGELDNIISFAELKKHRHLTG